MKKKPQSSGAAFRDMRMELKIRIGDVCAVVSALLVHKYTSLTGNRVHTYGDPNILRRWESGEDVDHYKVAAQIYLEALALIEAHGDAEKAVKVISLGVGRKVDLCGNQNKTR